MVTHSQQCDLKRIESYLEDKCDPDNSAELLKHLDGCESCQAYMKDHAAAPELWSEAFQLLPKDTIDTEAFLSGDGSVVSNSLQSHGIDSVLKSLIPSENLDRLGRLGIYEVIGVVGAGGMGVVLKAIDPSLDRTVAIKVMYPALATHGAARQRFHREAKAAAAVIHPNVIPIHGVSSGANGLPYLVMAYVGGGSLQKRLSNEGAFRTQELLRVGAQISAGLAAAHDQGLVHRDIKPANIMLENSVERLAITDFGLARAVDDASLTREGTIAGTPQYMSPEQAKGESVTAVSDLFSLGSVLYSLATGRPPFRADSSYGVMRRICDLTPVPIRELNPDIPNWLCRVIEKLMAKDPVDRFESASEVSQVLESSLAHVQHPTRVALPKSVLALQTNTHRFFPYRKVGIMSAVLISLLSVIWFVQLDEHRFAPRNDLGRQIAHQLAIWKEQPFDSEEDRQMGNELLEEYLEQVSEADSKEQLKISQIWANELLPILLAGVDDEKAQLLVKLTEPFDAIREGDRAAIAGKVAKPVGWDWQAVHMLSLGRAGLLNDSYRESELLIRKVNLRLGAAGGKNTKVNFLGSERSLEEVLRECRLHRATIEAIHGPPSRGPDSNESSEGTENRAADQVDEEVQESSGENVEESFELEQLSFSQEIEKVLAAIPHRPSLLQANENLLAIFEVDGDRLVAQAIRHKKQPALIGIACWNRLTTLFPGEYRKGIVQFNIQGGRRWAGFFNGAGTNDVGRKGYSLTIAEYVGAEEPDLANPNRVLTPRRGTLDWTTVHEMGHFICLSTNAIELFSQAFDGNDKPQPRRRKKPDDYPEDGSPVTDGNFVTSYAERTPGDEEVCETFTTYLLIDELPENDSLAAKKIRFFETLPGFPELRKHIQSVGNEPGDPN